MVSLDNLSTIAAGANDRSAPRKRWIPFKRSFYSLGVSMGGCHIRGLSFPSRLNRVLALVDRPITGSIWTMAVHS
jgi:hypothetical protein